VPSRRGGRESNLYHVEFSNFLVEYAKGNTGQKEKAKEKAL
jgi:hypothetical protein